MSQDYNMDPEQREQLQLPSQPENVQPDQVQLWENVSGSGNFQPVTEAVGQAYLDRSVTPPPNMAPAQPQAPGSIHPYSMLTPTQLGQWLGLLPGQEQRQNESQDYSTATGPRVDDSLPPQIEGPEIPEYLALMDPSVSDTQATPTSESQQGQQQPLNQRMDLQGKLAIVTDGDSELGRHIVYTLGVQGCSILVYFTYTSGFEALEGLSNTVDRVHDHLHIVSGNASSGKPNSRDVAAIHCVEMHDGNAQLMELDMSPWARFPGCKVDFLIMNTRYDKPTPLGKTPDDIIPLSVNRNLQWPIAFLENILQQELFCPNASVVVVAWKPTSPFPFRSPISKAANEALASMVKPWALELPRLGVDGATVNAVAVDAEKMVMSDRPMELQEVADAILWHLTLRPEVRPNGGEILVSGRGLTWEQPAVLTQPASPERASGRKRRKRSSS